MNWDIPELDVAMCADRLVPPVTKWGTRRRTEPMTGTWNAYTHDYKATALIRDPDVLARTGCAAAVEVNFSTCEETHPVEILWWTYHKRRIARRWQELGVRVLVDLNVARKAREINLIGVPRGWTAYATRAHQGVPFEAIYEEFLLACEHAGTEHILFAVFGGGRRRIGRPCLNNGWEWVPEQAQTVRGIEVAYEVR